MIKVGVIGVGHIGKEHARVVAGTPGCELYGVIDANAERAQTIAAKHGTKALGGVDDLLGTIDAAVIASSTESHRSIGCRLLEAGIDCLVEKPIAGSIADADAMIESAAKHGRVLQIGHLERFNPALQKAMPLIKEPRFIEIHRLGSFVRRSLDIDVVRDLMIHDIDIVLALTGEMPTDVRAVGVPILTRSIDVCNARMEFSKCVANVTASRAYRDKVRKVRIFQPDAYISLDYQAQSGEVYRLVPGGGEPSVSMTALEVAREEPLKIQFRAFLDAIASRTVASCSGEQGRNALRVALQVIESAASRLG